MGKSSVTQECPTRLQVPHKNAPQERPTSVPYNSVAHECATRVSCKSAPEKPERDAVRPPKIHVPGNTLNYKHALYYLYIQQLDSNISSFLADRNQQKI